MNDVDQLNPHGGDGDHPVLYGCFVGWIFMLVVMLVVSLVFTETLGVLSPQRENAVGTIAWLVGVCLAGYTAALRSRTNHRKNAMLVGLLALVFVVANSPDGDGGGLWGELFEVFRNPLENWRYLVALLLTLPAAAAGFLFSERVAASNRQEAMHIIIKRVPLVALIVFAAIAVYLMGFLLMR